MSLKHSDIWRAIDRLAARHGTSPSGLARKAGLSPTTFNMSKRATTSRKRWPSTESIAHILRVTGTKLDDFVALASPAGEAIPATLPMVGLDAARQLGVFDEDGLPAGKAWTQIPVPAITDPRAFVVEITGTKSEPVYREGDRIVLSPAEKPRRGDRVALRVRSRDILIGRLGRESASMTEVTGFAPGAAPANVPVGEIEWLYRILWASQ